ncbi:MAG: NAD-dependent epimerase/dehydratase family protein [Phycisphaerales bacterium]|nr:NAD-dependent epimerase/dehydratase family protein [Phycisphaerales bacterium]
MLVTGAGGEMGHGLLKALSDRYDGTGTAVVAMDIRELEPAQRALCRDAFVGDVCDTALLERLLAMYEIMEIYHLAALLSTRGEYSPETAHTVNVTGTLNLLRLAAEQARSHGARVKFVFPSSIAVYGLPDLATKNSVPPLREDQFCEPITMYGCNKLYGEHLGRYYARHYRLLAKDRMDRPIDFRCIRFPGIISADTVPSGGTSDYAPEMVHAAAAGRPYSCFVRPDARIPFMTMPDAIDAIVRLAAADGTRLTRCVYNITSFSPSASEIAELVREFFPASEVSFQPDAARQGIVDSWPAEVDDSAARRDWGYRPEHTLRSAFESYLVPRVMAHYRGA